MDYNLKFSLELDVTGKDVEEFYAERKDCLRKLEVFFKSNEIYSFFKSVYQELKEQVKGTELENEEFFNSIDVMKRNILDNAKVFTYERALQNFISEKIPMNNENVLEVIDMSFMLSLLKRYKEVSLMLIELFKDSEQEDKEELRQEIYEPNKLLN